MRERPALRVSTHALAIAALLLTGAFTAAILIAGAPDAPNAAAAASARSVRLPATMGTDRAATSARASRATQSPRKTPTTFSKADAARLRASLPLYFEPNVGQTDRRVRFLSQTGRHTLFLTGDAAVFSMVGGRIRKGPTFENLKAQGRTPATERLVEAAVAIRMVGARPHPQMRALDPLPGRVNYLIGNDPSKYHRDVPTYGRVRVSSVYPGIDVVYYGTPSALEYDIIAAPGADPTAIRFAIEGGLRSTVDAVGNIDIVTAAGTITMHRPRSYQRAADGSAVPIASSYTLAKNGAAPEYTIRLASYDRTRPLVIDPIASVRVLYSTEQLLYSSYLGGAAESTGPVTLEQFSGITANTPLTVADVGTDVALDPSNKAYITGIAYSGAASFPLVNAFQSTQTGANSPPNQNPVGFIAKFDTTQSGANSLIYSTYFGGQGDTNAADAGHGNGDLPFGIAVDASGEPFIVGQTYSTDFPDTASCGAFGRTNDQKATDVNVGFVAKLNSAGSAVVYSCYIDGSNNATESRVALYPAGCDSSPGSMCKAYVSGSTQSDHTTGFPVTGSAFQNTLKGTNGKSNATFIVVHEDGQSLDYATLYGGSGNGTNADAGLSIAVDSQGHGYLAGGTYSSDLTTKNAAVSTYNAGASAKKVSNAFVAKFDPTLSGASSLLYATYLGGSGSTGQISVFGSVVFSLSIGDVATAIRIDPVSGLIWVAGVTASTNFTAGTFASPFEASNQAEAGAGAPATAGFIAELDTSKAGLNQVVYRTYFGGGGLQLIPPAPATGTIGVGDAIVDLATTGPRVYVTGATASGTVPSGFPLSANACQTLNKSAGINIQGFAVPITAFAAEIDPSQSGAAELDFATLLGGSGTADAGTGVAIDGFGDMVVSGLTYSSDFPVTTTAFQSSNGAAANSATNAFLSVLYPAGTLCGSGGGTPVPTPSSTPTPSPTPTPGGLISITGNPLIFPNSGVGGVPTNAKFTIQNLSSKHDLVGSVGSPGAGPFTFRAGSGPFDLPPLGILAVKMTFTPTAIGLANGSLQVTSNDKLGHSPITVNLSGTGFPGSPSLSVPALGEPPNPIALSFGTVGINLAAGKTLNLVITNVGLGALAGVVSPLSAPYSIVSGTGVGGSFGPLAPGGVDKIKVAFSPTAVGPAAPATLVITTNNPKPARHILNVPLSGTGAPGHLATNIPALNNDTIGFGTISHTGPPKSLSFKIKNVGLGELLGNVPALGGTFTVTAGSGAFDLPPGGSQVVTVQFAPPGVGAFSQALAITVTPPGKPAAGITVTLKGHGS